MLCGSAHFAVVGNGPPCIPLFVFGSKLCTCGGPSASPFVNAGRYGGLDKGHLKLRFESSEQAFCSSETILDGSASTIAGAPTPGAQRRRRGPGGGGGPAFLRALRSAAIGEGEI